MQKNLMLGSIDEKGFHEVFDLKFNANISKSSAKKSNPF